MTSPFQPALDFEAAERAQACGEALVLELDGYEGPLHLLLALARGQKVDLREISMARLAEQYLAFIESERSRRFGLAAEYLVMAAWLAYLKSRLLLPKPEVAHVEDSDAQEMAEALAFRLAKLDAMRAAAEALKDLPQWGREVFGRGSPDPDVFRPAQPPEENLYALMSAYVDVRRRPERGGYLPPARVEAYPIEAARDRLRALLPALKQWTLLQDVAPRPTEGEGPSRASCLASTFSAGLEMSRDGALELRQREAFAEMHLRARPPAAA